MKNKPLKIGVIGIGHLGKNHARIYSQLPNAELVGVCDTDPSKAALAKDFGTPFYENYKDLVGKVEAVSIAVPTSQHYAVAKEILSAGIHALVEKPITNNLAQADELIAIAKEKNLALQVGHIERYNAGFRAVKNMAQKIRFIEIHRLGPFTPRINDCGVVLDLMIHDLDIVLGLMDSKVTYLDVVGVNVITPFEDIANVRMRFENGAIANLTASRLTPERQRKIRIFQENAYISLDYENQTAQIFSRENNQIQHRSVDIQKEEPLKAELEAFVNLVQTGSGFGKPDVAARNALELALRITQEIQATSPKMATR